MAIKVIAQRRELKIGKNPGVKKFVMRPDLYIPIRDNPALSYNKAGLSLNKAGLLRSKAEYKVNSALKHKVFSLQTVEIP